MRLLLDAHALIWWLAGDARLPARARTAIDDHREQLFVSAASAWEIATKVRIGKLPGAAAIATDIASIVLSEGFRPLSLTIEHGERVGGLPGPLRDPFDRMLIAQAMLEDLHLVSIGAASTPTGSRACGEQASRQAIRTEEFLGRKLDVRQTRAC